MAKVQQLQRGAWSEDEHQWFLAAMAQFPQGPWKAIAESVGSRSVRQVQTHAQQHHEKSARKVLGLRRDRKRSLADYQQRKLHRPSESHSSSEIVSLWRTLTAQGATDGMLATGGSSSGRLKQGSSDEDLVIHAEQ